VLYAFVLRLRDEMRWRESLLHNQFHAQETDFSYQHFNFVV